MFKHDERLAVRAVRNRQPGLRPVGRDEEFILAELSETELSGGRAVVTLDLTPSLNEDTSVCGKIPDDGLQCLQWHSLHRRSVHR